MLNKIIYLLQRTNDITNVILEARQTEDNLIGFTKIRYKNQLIKTNKALINYVSQLIQNNLLSTCLPEKI